MQKWIFMILLSAFAINPCLGGCAKAPVTERQSLILVPAAQLAELGEQAYREVLSESRISHREDWNQTVQRVGQRIAVATQVDQNWEFTVIDDPATINAFALPGGKIAIYSGMLRMAKDEAGLAAVMGHEVAHVMAQHSGERMTQGMILQLGLTAAQLSLEDVKQRDLIMGLLGVGVQLGVMLPYSRLHEREADTIGLTYMARAGYDPNAAVELWQRMATESPSGVPQLLSTHPASGDRAADLRSRIASVLPIYQASDKQAARLIDVSGM